jgi:enolase-phosphatase E1
VTDSHSENQITTILLDIEGTTTPIDFVYKTLFPYARAHIRKFVMASLSAGQLSDDLVGLIQEHSDDVAAGHSPPPTPVDPQNHPDSLVNYVYWLMDQDRKSTPLKSIQGKIWEAGYKSGELKSEVFPDVPRAFDRWATQGRDISIYSSGSVLAQKLLFANTQAGDLTRFITSYFDTNTGAKKEAASYSRIAGSLRREPGEILFISDVTDELGAAKLAGLETLLCVRPGNHPQAEEGQYRVVSNFDDAFPA